VVDPTLVAATARAVFVTSFQAFKAAAALY
jgi:hypothetical protein